MKIINFLALLLIVFFSFSCSKDAVKESAINEKNLELQVIEAYEEGMKNLESKDAIFAAKKFNEAEILFPQSIWAPKSALMAAYAYYSEDYYASNFSQSFLSCFSQSFLSFLIADLVNILPDFVNALQCITSFFKKFSSN